MAITVANVAETGSAASATLAITTPTAGNLLVVFFAQIASTTAPKGKDTVGGETGWSLLESGGSPVKAITDTSARSMFVLIKTAVGNEVELNPKVEGGGTIQGLSCIELKGATTTIDTYLKHQEQPSTNVESYAGVVSTTDAGSITLMGVSGTTTASGTIKTAGEETTGTPFSTATARLPSLYYLPGTTLSSATVKMTWTTAKPFGSVLVALKPAAATEGAVMLM